MNSTQGPNGSPESIFETEYSLVRKAVGNARSDAPRLRQGTVEHQQRLDQLFANHLSTGAQIACKRGCSFCCYLKTDVTPNEVFRLTDFIRNRFSEAETAEVIRRAKETVAKTRPMSLHQHQTANLPCPLLRDGACSCYEARPDNCRTFHAQRVSTCEDSFNNPQNLSSPDSQIAELRPMLQAHHDAATMAFAQERFDFSSYDLPAALLEALEYPACERRWRNGERAFGKRALAKDAPEQQAAW